MGVGVLREVEVAVVLVDAGSVANNSVSAGSGAGNFWAKITGLTPGTYYIRAYAIKKGIVYYSYNELEFIWVY